MCVRGTFQLRFITKFTAAGFDLVAYYLLKLNLMRFQMPKIGLGSREQALPSVIVAVDMGRVP